MERLSERASYVAAVGVDLLEEGGVGGGIRVGGRLAGTDPGGATLDVTGGVAGGDVATDGSDYLGIYPYETGRVGPEEGRMGV